HAGLFNTSITLIATAIILASCFIQTSFNVRLCATLSSNDYKLACGTCVDSAKHGPLKSFPESLPKNHFGPLDNGAAASVGIFASDGCKFWGHTPSRSCQ
ncbi:MAG TPA: hypothetical protein VLM19_06675, partial [Nitrospiraceae bacterium]|nr:hypothetical protein [Nitrospiraceae bacterium]